MGRARYVEPMPAVLAGAGWTRGNLSATVAITQHTGRALLVPGNRVKPPKSRDRGGSVFSACVMPARYGASMARAVVVNIKHKSAKWDIYVGRPGKGQPGPLGNPIAIGKRCIECGAVHGRDAALLDCYRAWLERKVSSDAEYRELVLACHGKRLGCFCVRRNGLGLCHGYVLAEVAERLAAPKPAQQPQERKGYAGWTVERGAAYIAALPRVERTEREPLDTAPRVDGDAAWYRVGHGLTTCPHLAYQWAQARGQRVELLDRHPRAS